MVDFEPNKGDFRLSEISGKVCGDGDVRELLNKEEADKTKDTKKNGEVVVCAVKGRKRVASDLQTRRNGNRVSAMARVVFERRSCQREAWNLQRREAGTARRVGRLSHQAFPSRFRRSTPALAEIRRVCVLPNS